MSSNARPVQWHNTECVCVHVHVLVYVYMYANDSKCCVFVLGHAVWVFGSWKCAALISFCSDRCKSGKLWFLSVQTAASLASFDFFLFRPLQVWQALISFCSDCCKSGKLWFLCVQTAASLASFDFFVFRPLQVWQALISLCSDCCKSGNISKACQPLCLNQPSGAVDCSKEDHNILTCAAGKYAYRCDTVELGTAAGVSNFIGHLSVWLQQNLVLQQELVDWLTLITFIWHILACVM